MTRIPHHTAISRPKFGLPSGKIWKILFEIHAAPDFSPVHRIADAIYFALKEYSLYPPMRKAGDVFLINLSPTTLYYEITLTETFAHRCILDIRSMHDSNSWYRLGVPQW